VVRSSSRRLALVPLPSSFYAEVLRFHMPRDQVEVEWVSLPGPASCTGCARTLIPTGTRALRLRRGPRGTERISGTVFHGFACLADRSTECAADEERNGSGRDDAYRELEYWARNQDRNRRSQGQI
jgi:hypothetical protein